MSQPRLLTRRSPSRPPNASGPTRPPSYPGRPARTRPVRQRPGAARRRASGLRFADLFAGIGGFHLALQRTGGECVFASEINPAARRTYEANFAPTSPELFAAGQFAGDITAVAADSVPDFDVLCAGFPCQPFSLAGRRRGFADPRGTMFFEILRMLEAKRPAAYFLENVQGLQSHDDGQTLEVIRRSLSEELGYSFHLRTVRACDFGLPQLRPRLFMVGFRDPQKTFSFPEPVPLTMTMDDVFGGRCDRRIGYTILASGRGQPMEPRRARAWDAYIVDGQLRRLGPREALMMQGFPDSFILPESVPQAMKQLGNAVAVPAVEATARQIARSLGYGPSQPPVDQHCQHAVTGADDAKH